MSIIQNRMVWMRNAITMNDYSEMEHGYKCLTSALSSSEGVRLRDFLDWLYPGFTDKLLTRFDIWLPTFKTGTYLTCLSEHETSENDLGRLSMWRAYGGNNGIALVIEPASFMVEEVGLGAYSSPVTYSDETQFIYDFSHSVDKIISSERFLRLIGPEALMTNMFVVFRKHVLCTKHPGFKEEREWRVIYTPQYDESHAITSSLRCVNGVPQIVFQMPLEDRPSIGLYADLSGLLHSLIVGPSQQPRTILDSFRALLQQSGYSEADAIRMVRYSGIPLRV